MLCRRNRNALFWLSAASPRKYVPNVMKLPGTGLFMEFRPASIGGFPYSHRRDSAASTAIDIGKLLVVGATSRILAQPGAMSMDVITSQLVA